MRVKKSGDTSLRNRTVVFGAILEHMPEGIARGQIVRYTNLKPEVVDRNLRKLTRDNFVTRVDRGKRKASPFLLHPHLLSLDYYEFEKKCQEAGLFRPEHSHVFLGEREDGRSLPKPRGSTIGKSYNRIKQMVRFLTSMPGTLGSPRSKVKRPSVAKFAYSRTREVGELVTRFSNKTITRSVQSQGNKRLLFFLQCWLSSMLRRKPMNVLDLRLSAPLGGKPLNSRLTIAVLELMKRDDLASSDENGRWHLTQKGREQIPDFYK